MPQTEFGCAKVDGRSCVATVDGELFDVIQPDPSKITIEVIAHGLSHNCRYAGQTPYHFSVAQHSVYCGEWAFVKTKGDVRAALVCLLHDGAEAYLGDLIRPLKIMLPESFHEIENRLQAAIWKRFGLEHGLEALIHEVDQEVLVAEAQQLMKGWEKWNLRGFDPAPIVITPWSCEQARSMFLSRWRNWRLELEGCSS